MEYRILLVDDEANILNALRRVLGAFTPAELEGNALAVETLTSPTEALRRTDYVPFDLVMSDYRMPGMNGIEFLKEFRLRQPNAARLILSGYADLDGLIGAINEAQIWRFVAKPWYDIELRAVIAQSLSMRRLIMENQRLADLVRVQQGRLSRQEMALRKLQEGHPGLAKVNREPDGSVLLDPEDD